MANITLLSGEATRERFFAFIIDNMLAVLLGFVALGIMKPHGEAAQWVAAVASYLSFFLVFEGLFGATPGKFGFGLRVTTREGGRCSWWQILTRPALRLVDANPLVLGALPGGVAVLSGPHRQRFGDMLAGTVVVSTSRWREAMPVGTTIPDRVATVESIQVKP
jgi:uncharacterized RDD family membrane protein YckC